MFERLTTGLGAGFNATTGITLHGFITVLALLAYVVAAHALNQRRHPTAAIAWVFFILLVPYIALPAFLVFGSRKQARPPLIASPTPAPPDAPPVGTAWALRAIAALGQPPPASYRALSVHRDGSEALAALWHTIDGATETLDVCTFILGNDPVGQAVVDRLATKARGGVRVRLMVDGMGQLMRRRPGLAPLTDAGGRFAVFVPPLRLPIRSRANLRDHRKMVIADAASARRRLWTGGRNLATEYFVDSPSGPAWRDLTFDLGGDLVGQAAALYARDWAYANGEVGATPAPPQARPAERPIAQVVASGPDEADDTIQTLLLTGAYQSERRIAIATPYFVPDSALSTALAMAARRGVVVDLLIPARSNHSMSDIARRRALRALAQAGGRIWLVPYMLHGKLAVFDDCLALSGSANIDSRSLFLNYEVMVAFHEPADIDRFVRWFDDERQSAERYVAKRPGLLADVAEGLVLWAGFQL